MATYIFGDVQGCFNQLIQLLEKINYDSTHDRLGFVGDLVNRGKQSLETLRFIRQLKNPIIVLGNHDLHLLALGFGVSAGDSHTLEPILNAPDKLQLLDWLRQQPLVFHEKNNNTIIVHAGIPPQWSCEKALLLANEVSDQLKNEKISSFLAKMYGNQPDQWSDDLQGIERWRYIINALTRMRFCSSDGKLDLENKTANSNDVNIYKPWFEWRHDKAKIVFGHWASLEGKCEIPNYFAIDTGCVWRNKLTAIRLEDKKLFSVPCHAL